MRTVIKRLFRDDMTEHDLPLGYKSCGVMVTDDQQVFGLFLAEPRNRICFVRLFYTKVGQPVEDKHAEFVGSAYVNGEERAYWISDV